jgi:hypothetical protein
MIKIVFSINREIFRLEIKDKVIWYSDRKWKRAIQLVPADDNFIKKIRMSRNRIPNSLIELFTLTTEELQQYNNAHNDKELAKICIADAKKKGATLVDLKINGNT